MKKRIFKTALTSALMLSQTGVSIHANEHDSNTSHVIPSENDDSVKDYNFETEDSESAEKKGKEDLKENEEYESSFEQSGEITDDITEPESEENKTEDDADSEEADAVSDKAKKVISESIWGTCKVTKYDDGSMVIGAGVPEIVNGYLRNRPWDSHIVTSIIFEDGFDTSSVTDMSNMFSGCSYLENLDLSSFDTSSVTDMRNMFYGCKYLLNLDLSNFDTSSVTDMSNMFYECLYLLNLDLSSFDTSSVTDMRNMFYDCPNLLNLDLSNFDTSNVTDMDSMFKYCFKLKSVNLSGFNTSNVTDMDHMFAWCRQLENLDLSSFDTSNVESMTNMFYVCERLKNLNISNFNTENVRNMENMFSNCRSLENLDVSNFDTSNVSDMGGMFSVCESLKSLDVSNFNTSKVRDMSGMFSYTSLEDLDLSNFNTSNVSDMSGMFAGSSLKSLDVSNFNTSKVRNMARMFLYCRSLENLDVSNFDTKLVLDMSGMFESCSSLVNLDLSNFNTQYVTNMEEMFRDCSNLVSLEISNFDTTYVSNMLSFYYGCDKLESINLSKNYFQSSNAAGAYPRNFDTVWQQKNDPSNLKTWEEMAKDWKASDAGWWIIPKQTLTFNTNGGSAVSPVTESYGTEVDLSTYTPTREGYTFTGWYSDADLKNMIDTITLNGDTTVYAGWQINQQTLTFNTNGGSAISPVTENYGTEVDLSNYAPTRDGYKFDGWYSDADLKNKIDTVTLNGDATVYAGWEINKATLTFNTNGGSTISPLTEDYGTEVVLDDYTPSRTGYTFTGWYSDVDLNNKIDTVQLTEDTTVYAGWEINKVTLTFETNGGNAISPLTADYGTEVDLGDYTPSRTGHTFTGWYSDSDLKNKIETVNLTGDTTVYAGWQINQQTLTFDTNGGTAIAPVTADYGSEINLNEYVSTRTGYTFTGWYSDPELKDKVETVSLTEDTTIYAGWEINKVTLTFNTNGGSTVSPITADYGTDIDLSDYVPAKEGYTFTGWYSDVDLNNKIDTVQLTEDTTVYVGWQINKQTLTFDSNGGTSIAPITADYGTEIDLNEYVPSRTGYGFAGWYSDPELKNNIATVKLTGDTTVYAGWEINKVTLSFETNGGSTITPLAEDYGTVINLKDFSSSREGYSFTGWYSDPDLKNRIETVTLNGDTPVYAGWQINEYTLSFDSNGGSSIPSITRDYGTELTLESYVPVREGYTFTGWYSDADLKNKVDTVTLNGNTTIYAGWKINRITLSFDINGGSEISPVTEDYGTEVSLAGYVPVKEGYIFTGWYLDPDLKEKIDTVKLAEDTTVYAGWEISKAELSFDTNGGSMIDPVTADYGTEIGLNQYVPEKDGYNFTGWYSDPDFKNKIDSVVLKADITVYAGWKEAGQEQEKATLSFITNGGSALDPVTAEIGTKIDLNQYEPIRKGYTFTGWYSDEDLKHKVESITLDADTTVYAGWKKSVSGSNSGSGTASKPFGSNSGTKPDSNIQTGVASGLGVWTWAATVASAFAVTLAASRKRKNNKKG